MVNDGCIERMGETLTRQYNDICEMTTAIGGPDSYDALLLAVGLGDGAGERPLGIAQDELDAELLAEKPGVDTGLSR